MGRSDQSSFNLLMGEILFEKSPRLCGPGHMKVDTCGKRYLHTFHMAFKAKRTSAKVPRSIKESCCGNMAIRRLECLEGRRWHLIHCSSSSSMNSSWGEAKGVAYRVGSLTSWSCLCLGSYAHRYRASNVC